MFEDSPAIIRNKMLMCELPEGLLLVHVDAGA